MPVIAQMHHAGFQQLDLSLNHFVCNHNHSLMCMNSGHADGLHSLADERLAQIHKNLAKLLAQLPIIYDQSIKDFLISYQLGSVLCKKLSYSARITVLSLPDFRQGELFSRVSSCWKKICQRGLENALLYIRVCCGFSS